MSIPEVAVFKKERYRRVAHCCTGGSVCDMLQNMGSKGQELPVHMQHIWVASSTAALCFALCKAKCCINLFPDFQSRIGLFIPLSVSKRSSVWWVSEMFELYKCWQKCVAAERQLKVTVCVCVCVSCRGGFTMKLMKLELQGLSPAWPPSKAHGGGGPK